MNFPEKLKFFRIQNGYTQEEFARLIGVERSSISLYESGKIIPDVYKAVKIATIMGTTCEELVSERNRILNVFNAVQLTKIERND